MEKIELNEGATWKAGTYKVFTARFLAETALEIFENIIEENYYCPRMYKGKLCDDLEYDFVRQFLALCKKKKYRLDKKWIDMVPILNREQRLGLIFSLAGDTNPIDIGVKLFSKEMKDKMEKNRRKK